MMNFLSKNFRIGKFLDVNIDVQLLLVLFITFISLFKGLNTALTMVAMFGCVILHEYGHILMARYYGISCFRMLMTPLGGIAFIEMEEGARSYKPVQQFWIAAAGPIVSAILAVFFLLIGIPSGIKFIITLGVINLVLVIFNLIPAYPMDGGRIFKALISIIFTKNYRKAGRLTGAVGMGFAALITVFFLYNANFISAMIGIFIGMQAYHEYKTNTLTS